MEKSNNLASENFLSRGRHYFLDFKISNYNSNDICITRSDSKPDGSYTRQRVTLFLEDFEMLVGCFSSLFCSAAYFKQRDRGVQGMHSIDTDKPATGIKGWKPELRPREKMLKLGQQAMGNAELLAMLIGSGSPTASAVVLADRILDSVDGDLQKLSGLKMEEFCSFVGMGVAKSSAILAAMELARRLYAPGLFP